MYAYLLLNIVLLLITAALSFSGREKFVVKWIFVFPSILLTTCLFVLWEHYFTIWKILSFTPEYVSGWYVFALPLEEVLSFFAIPFSFFLLYEKVNARFPVKRISNRRSMLLCWMLVVLFAGLVIICMEQVYTAVVSLFILILLLQHLLVFRRRYYGKFLRAFLIFLLPLFLIRTVLTAIPVMVYHPDYIIGLKLLTVPVEDLVYVFFMLFFNLSIYEFAQGGTRAVKLQDKRQLKTEEVTAAQ